MKATNIFFALLLNLPVVSIAQLPFIVEGKVGNRSSRNKIFLSYRGLTGDITDSSVLRNGAFKFSGEVARPCKAYLYLDGKGAPMYLEKGRIQVQADDSIEHMVVRGGKENAAFTDLLSRRREVDNSLTQLSEEYYRAMRKKLSADSLYKEDEKKRALLNVQEKAITQNFIESYPEMQVSFDELLSNYGSIPDAKEVEPLYMRLSSALRNSEMGKEYGGLLKIWKATAVGVVAPDFIQSDTAGDPVSLKQFRGKYVLIDFWASWCGPCRADNPTVVDIYNKYKIRNFTVIGISLDRKSDRDKWIKAIQDDRLPWVQLSDLQYWKNEVAALYGIRFIPQNFLLNPDGIIIAKNIHQTELREKMKEIFDADGL